MHSTSLPLLLVAAGTVGFLHSILPDHWVPLAVVARTERWTLLRTARTSLLASVGHVLTSIVLGGVIAAVGLQFRKSFETQQGHIVGIVLVITGIGFLIWGLGGHGHRHHHDDHDEDLIHARAHPHEESHRHIHGHEFDEHHEYGEDEHEEPSGARRMTAILIPFGAAASPD